MSELQGAVQASPEENKSAEGKEAKADTLVDYVFDLGTEWAASGLDSGQKALEHSAKTLGKLASTLDSLRKQLLAKA